jgi:PAS domain S-box-containing protein
MTLIASGAATLGETSPTSWGWSFHPGALFFVHYVVTMAGILFSCFVISRSTSRASVGESHQLPWMWIAIGTPAAGVFTTNVLLPLLQVDAPRLGSASLAVTGGIVAWTVLHYGLSLITSRGFGDEILETLEDGVALLSADGAIRRANRALAGLSGHSPKELEGMRMSELVDRDFREPSELEDLRRELLRRDGERIPVSVSIGVLRERQENEIGVVVAVRDLRELEELRRSSVTNARLAAVGELAAGLAHEINNPIAFVASNLRMLRDHWEQVTSSGQSAIVSEGRELIAESIDGVERATEIIRGVKDFSHTPSIERRPAHLRELIDESVRMIQAQIGPGVRIEREYAGLPQILAAPRELEQVFLNLLLNAVHAVEGDGVVRVSTRLEGDLAVVCFEDDGYGIAPDRIDRIFDPFFTTKPVGEGTGLGLGIAHHIVTQHGGSISVQSQPGEGATFRVNLPLS